MRGSSDPRHGRAAALEGLPVSSGVGIGSALVLRDADEEAVVCREIPHKSVRSEVQRLEKAFLAAEQEVSELKERVSSEVGAERARIFEAQMLMLTDDKLAGEAVRTVERQRVNAEWALREARDRLLAEFNRLGSEYFRDRLWDVKDVTRRVARKLSGAGDAARVSGTGIVLVSPELTPSEAATLDTSSVRAFVIEAGGRTSHTAILAKSMGIPAVVGVAEATVRIRTGDPVLVDGARGMVLIAPTPHEIRDYMRRERTRHKHDRVVRRDRSKPSKTLDGRKVFLQANIELPEEVEAALSAGGEGIGLYRTEFLFLAQKDGHEPSEEEHYEVYKAIATRVNPYSAIIRTLDLGGEKLMRHQPADRKAASVLGLRAIRLCLARPDLFRAQLRAILRASAYGRIKIMLPFVSSVEEVRQAKAILRECMADLKRHKVRFNETIEIGVMIEVPAAAMTADVLAKEVSFFSIGTNDLIQYLLAVDRADDSVAHLYEPLHPALLRMLHHVIQAAHRQNVRVGMCGEMAAEPLFTPLLVGLGLDELSMDPKSLPAVKYVLRSISYDECIRLSQELLQTPDPKAVREKLQAFLGPRVPAWLVARA